LARYPFNLARYMATLAATLIALTAMLALLWRLHDAPNEPPATRAPPAEPLPMRGTAAALRRTLLAVLYAGFVVGWLDDFVIVSLPVGFVLAVVLFRTIVPLGRAP
jgi:hypothetical protein